MKYVALALVVVAAACNGTIAEPPAPRLLEIPLQPRVYHLPNGIKVTLLPDAEADLASVLVRYHTGAIDDPPDQRGVAHLAAHMSYAPGDKQATLWDQLDSVATWLQAIPEAETTDFTAQTQPASLGNVLHLEAARLTARCEDISDEWFTWLRGQVAGELRANTTRLTNRAVDHALYERDDPYRAVYDADPDSVNALTQHQVCAFMAQHYGPANTEVVVSGPLDPTAFEALARRELGSVPAHSVAQPAKRPAPIAQGFTVKVAADVAEPTLVISWPLPADAGAREVMLFAASALADKTKVDLYNDDHQLLLWVTKNKFGFDAAVARIRSALAPGLVSHDEFEQARTTRVTQALLRLDAIPSRMRELARESRIDAPYHALEVLDPAGFDRLVATYFDWSHARVLELEPDGSRPRTHPASLSDPPHSMKGPSEFPLADVAPSAAPSRVLARARTFTLANGLRVMLVPTSPVPVIDIRLDILAGTADEPADHPGTSIVAAAAFAQLAKRGPRAAASAWAAGIIASGAGLDASGISVHGPTMYVDLLFQQLEGATATLALDDLQKGREKLVEIASSPLHAMWDRGVVVRGNLYGAAHPYAQARPPTAKDVREFDARVVEDFYAAHYAPDNATLIITGGFDPDAVAQLVQHTFGAWQGHGTRGAPLATSAKPGVFAVADTTPTVHVTVMWPGVGLDDHYEARNLLAATMNATFAAVHAQYLVHPRGSDYRLSAALDPATAADDIRTIVDGLHALAAGTPRYRAAFSSARRRGVLAQAGGASSVGSWSDWMIFALLNGRDLGWLAGSTVRTANTTFADIAALAAAELPLDRAVWYVTGPRAAVDGVYRALDLQPTWLDP